MVQSGESTHLRSLAAVENAFTDIDVGIGERGEAAVMRVREMMMITRMETKNEIEKGAGNMMIWVCVAVECLDSVCLIATCGLTRHLVSCADNGGVVGRAEAVFKFLHVTDRA